MLLADVIAMLPLCLQLMIFCLAVVVAMLLCCYRIDGDVLTIRPMFLALLADVIAMLVVVGVTTMINSCTRKCAISVLLFLADVIAKMADVVAMFLIGRCYCHVTDVIATVFLFCCFSLFWQVLLPCG